MSHEHKILPRRLISGKRDGAHCGPSPAAQRCADAATAAGSRSRARAPTPQSPTACAPAQEFAGKTSCELCPRSFFQNSTGQSYCYACPPNSETYLRGTSNITECLCQALYWAPTRAFSMGRRKGNDTRWAQRSSVCALDHALFQLLARVAQASRARPASRARRTPTAPAAWTRPGRRRVGTPSATTPPSCLTATPTSCVASSSSFCAAAELVRSAAAPHMHHTCPPTLCLVALPCRRFAKATTRVRPATRAACVHSVPRATSWPSPGARGRGLG